jgi:hypothetical protein
MEAKTRLLCILSCDRIVQSRFLPTPPSYPTLFLHTTFVPQEDATAVIANMTILVLTLPNETVR